MLTVTIALLAYVQWEIGTRGRDLAAGLLTIIMVALGFGLIGVLIVMLPGRIFKAEGWEEQDWPRRSFWEEHTSSDIRTLRISGDDPWDDPSWYDSKNPVSPFYYRRDD